VTEHNTNVRKMSLSSNCLFSRRRRGRSSSRRRRRRSSSRFVTLLFTEKNCGRTVAIALLLCVMAAESKDQLIRVLKKVLKAELRTHFRFYEPSGKHELDKPHPVCQSCQTKILYLSNTPRLNLCILSAQSAKLITQELRRTCQICPPTLKERGEHLFLQRGI